VHPIALNLGGYPIYWYGVLMAVAFFVGLRNAGGRARRAGVAPETITDAGLWLIAGTVVGARSLFVATHWQEFFAGQPWWEVFNIRSGGLVFYGGFIGAALACILYSQRKQIPLWKLADILTPSLALGYVFGRIGCLLNGCCFGRACDLAWAIRFPNQSAAWDQHSQAGLVGPGDPSLPVHPTQVYDSLLSLALYAALAWLHRRKKFDGQVFAVYLMAYAVTRSLVETFRGDYSAAHRHGGLTPAHLISIGIFAAGAVLYALRSRSAGRTGKT
jgi:phosphatidylglycerol:prolipoprotein diacylglycerol transferase